MIVEILIAKSFRRKHFEESIILKWVSLILTIQASIISLVRHWINGIDPFTLRLSKEHWASS